MTPSHMIYLRGLRQVDHTVFCVANGQKTYFEPQFRRVLPYSSGQQVKRSILDHLTASLGTGRAPVEFRYKLEKGTTSPKEDIAVLPLHPKNIDELLGGYMRAEGKKDEPKGKGKKADDQEPQEKDTSTGVIKRRSPLSISAMRPLHPLLAGTDTEKSITFDRTGDARSTISLLDPDGKPLTPEEMKDYLSGNELVLRKAKYVDARNARRAYGLYVFDVAIDLRRLFSVSIDPAEPEITPKVQKELRDLGWEASYNAFGPCLVAPAKERERIIPALAEALTEWQITSNQARTYNPMDLMALAISNKPYHVTGAIRADLQESGDAAMPVLEDPEDGAGELFITRQAQSRILGTNGRTDALRQAQESIVKRLLAYDYMGK